MVLLHPLTQYQSLPDRWGRDVGRPGERKGALLAAAAVRRQQFAWSGLLFTWHPCPGHRAAINTCVQVPPSRDGQQRPAKRAPPPQRS